MVTIRDYGDSEEVPISLTAHERRKLWDECMKECEGHLKQAEFDQIIREVYGYISSPHSKTESESSSSGSMDIFMEMARSLIEKEVLSYGHIVIGDNDISKLHSNKQISSTRNEEDVVLEPCVVGERVCITRQKGVSDEYFYFYSVVIENFKICIPFVDFESDLPKTLNIAPSQLRPDDWGFIKDFGLVCKW